MQIFFYFIFLFFFIPWIEKLQFHLIVFSKKTHPSLELENWLRGFEWGKYLNQEESFKLPNYKFYTSLIEIILNFSRTYGGRYKDIFLILREALRFDSQFEKRLKDIILGTYFQIIVISILTWGFIFLVWYLTRIRLSFGQHLFLIVWQFIGVSLIPYFSSSLRKKYFSDIGQLWHVLFSLYSLQFLPIPRTEVFKLSGVQNLKKIKQKSVGHIVEKIHVICEEATKKGQNYEEDLKLAMDELRFTEKWHCELFEKRMVILKLVILSLFFLPSYLMFIFFILGHLMRLM